MSWIPGIWFEFESVGTGSKHYNVPDHLLKRDGVPITVGEQLVIRELGNKFLAIAHRFGESKDVATDFLEGATVIASYGELSVDFSAKAWIYEK